MLTLTTLGIKGALSIVGCPSNCSGSSSSSEWDADDDGATESGEGFCIGEEPEDGVGDARAAKRDCETSERRSEARFCDLVNLPFVALASNKEYTP